MLLPMLHWFRHNYPSVPALPFPCSLANFGVRRPLTFSSSRLAVTVWSLPGMLIRSWGTPFFLVPRYAFRRKLCCARDSQEQSISSSPPCRFLAQVLPPGVLQVRQCQHSKPWQHAVEPRGKGAYFG